MRLWSLHPSQLDAKGLVALWREGLLARKVLEGKTKGYTNHPQLARFKACKEPLKAIDAYLEGVVHEAKARGYNFDESKIRLGMKIPQMPVTDGQVAHETKHLKAKLETRDPKKLKELHKREALIHPIFKMKQGPVEEWERVTDMLAS
jgi:hypothetical protein